MEYKSLAVISSIVIFGILETLVPFFQYHQTACSQTKFAFQHYHHTKKLDGAVGNTFPKPFLLYR